MSTMQAAYRDRYGPPDIVEVREVERPIPAEDDVLVRVHAASLNRADLDNLYAKPSFTRLFLGLRRPRNHRLGLDVAGVVEAVGAAVTRFKPGDRVFADLYPFGYGAFAEYACAPERVFQSIPDAVTFETAATLPHSAILAIQGLRLRDGRTIRPGDRVLIVGAAGNVGPFAIQIAKSMGAEVTGICHTDGLDFVRSLGADHLIDYTTTDYTTTGERYDWILDTDSHNPIFQARRALRPNGVYLTLGGTGGQIVKAATLGLVASRATGKTVGMMLWWKPFHAPDVAALLDMILAGTLSPAVDRRFELREVPEALRHLDRERPKGKVIITMVPESLAGSP